LFLGHPLFPYGLEVFSWESWKGIFYDACFYANIMKANLSFSQGFVLLKLFFPLVLFANFGNTT
jgi:hypothetical protein